MGKSAVSLWSKTTRDEPWFLCAPPLISMHGGEDIYGHWYHYLGTNVSRRSNQGCWITLNVNSLLFLPGLLCWRPRGNSLGSWITSCAFWFCLRSTRCLSAHLYWASGQLMPASGARSVLVSWKQQKNDISVFFDHHSSSALYKLKINALGLEMLARFLGQKESKRGTERKYPSRTKFHGWCETGSPHWWF